MASQADTLARLAAAPGFLHWWQISETYGGARVMVHRIRKRLGPGGVEWIRGTGYRLTPVGREALKRCEVV